MTYPLTSAYTDANGLQILLSDNVRDLLVVDVSGTEFQNPGALYTGYAADGKYYSSGTQTSDPSATWASQTPDQHRGPLNRFPTRSYVVLTDKELSIIDASDFTLFLRAVVYEPLSPTPTDGTFLEWVADADHSGFFSALGVYGMSFNGAAWADGRIIVATDNGLRVLDFRADAAYVFHDTGYNSAALSTQKGLEYRNKPEYFSPTTVTSHLGITDSAAVTARTIGNVTYYVASKNLGAAVFFWGNYNFWGSGTSLKHSTLFGTPEALTISNDGTLYLLEDYDPGGGSLLRTARNVSEWRNSTLSGFNDTVGISLPAWAGVVGSLALRGDDVYVGANTGIWKMPEDLSEYELYYGVTDSSISAPVEPRYTAMTDEGSPVTQLATDPSTGHLGALHGNVLDVVNVGINLLEETYDLSSDPALPASPRTLATYSFDTPEVW